MIPEEKKYPSSLNKTFILNGINDFAINQTYKKKIRYLFYWWPKRKQGDI